MFIGALISWTAPPIAIFTDVEGVGVTDEVPGAWGRLGLKIDRRLPVRESVVSDEDDEMGLPWLSIESVPVAEEVP